MEKARFIEDRLLPIGTVVMALIVLWYVFVVVLNMPFERDDEDVPEDNQRQNDGADR